MVFVYDICSAKLQLAEIQGISEPVFYGDLASDSVERSTVGQCLMFDFGWAHRDSTGGLLKP